MSMRRTVGWGMIGGATTYLTRKAIRSAMHKQSGAPRLPRTVRHDKSFGTMVLLAVATGALLALGDVLQEQRKHVVEAPGLS